MCQHLHSIWCCKHVCDLFFMIWLCAGVQTPVTDHVSDCLYIGLVGDQAQREEVHIQLETFSEDGGTCAVVHIWPHMHCTFNHYTFPHYSIFWNSVQKHVNSTASKFRHNFQQLLFYGYIIRIVSIHYKSENCSWGRLNFFLVQKLCMCGVLKPFWLQTATSLGLVEVLYVSYVP